MDSSPIPRIDWPGDIQILAILKWESSLLKVGGEHSGREETSKVWLQRGNF